VGTGSFPGVKRPGRGADHPPPSKCRGHERVGLYLYSPSGPSWPVIGRTFTFTFTFTILFAKVFLPSLFSRIFKFYWTSCFIAVNRTEKCNWHRAIIWNNAKGMWGKGKTKLSLYLPWKRREERKQNSRYSKTRY
jgi:hypothetical protein